MIRHIAFIIILFSCISSHAQESVRVKDFGGFILDMGSMLNAESLVVSPMILPTLSYLAPYSETTPYQLNPDAFKLNPNITYMGGTNITSSRAPMYSLLYNGMGSGMVNWQGASYKLNNGMRINRCRRTESVQSFGFAVGAQQFQCRLRDEIGQWEFRYQSRSAWRAK